MRRIAGRRSSAEARRVVARSLATLALLVPAACWGYRPFEGTDAEVAGLRETEIELGPVGYLEQGEQRFLTAPLLVLNYGVVTDTELVAQTEALHTLPSDPRGPDFRLVNSGLFIKHVLRDGVLQDGIGPSVATEVGVLPPDVHGDSGLGASVAGIVSQRWNFGTAHLNAAVATNRAHHLDLFGGVILEGPIRWSVRPVSELFLERTDPASHTWSRLVGAIWQRSDRLAFDVGYRWASAGEQHEREVTAGFSWTLGAGR